MLIPTARIRDDQSSSQSEGACGSCAHAKNGDGIRTADDEYQLVRDAQRGQRRREVAVKNCSRAIGDAIEVRVGETNQSAWVRAAEKIGVLNRRHEQRTIRQSRHAKWEAQSAGKRGDAKVVGVHARPLHGEGLGDDVRGDEAKCESKCQPKNGWLRVRFSDQHELGMPAV